MDAIKFVEDWMENVWNKRDSDYVRKHLCPNCDIPGLPPEAQGVDGFIQFQQTLLRTIDNFHFEIQDVIAKDNKIIGMGLVTGNYYEDGQAISMDVAFSGTIKDGLIVEARNVVDFLALLEQAEKISTDSLAKVFNT